MIIAHRFDLTETNFVTLCNEEVFEIKVCYSENLQTIKLHRLVPMYVGFMLEGIN